MNIENYRIIEQKLDENQELVSALIECDIWVLLMFPAYDHQKKTFRYMQKTGWFDSESFEPLDENDSKQLFNMIYANAIPSF